MQAYVRKTIALGCVFTALLLALMTVMVGGYYFVEPGLPDADELRRVPLQVPLTVYSRDGRLLAQLGEKRRTPVAFEAIPPVMVQAVLAAEDDRFFEHPGFDYQGLLRAGINYLTTGSRAQGGSTITQQLAREYFLTRTRKFVRKFKELIIATRIESEFSKEEILELYLNKIFLGQRAYGVVAAAEVYFGKPLAELTVAEAAVIAGIPKGPSILNPVSNLEGALERRAYVLRRMSELGFIDAEQYQQASLAPLAATRHGPQVQLQAPYVAELVRAEMVRRFGLEVYTRGYRVTTSIDSRLQAAAISGLRTGLLEYDRRHGYRGPIHSLDVDALALPENASAEVADEVALMAHLEGLLSDYQTVGDLVPALVLSADPERAQVYVAGIGSVELPFAGMEWARPPLGEISLGPVPKGADDVLEPGAVIRVVQTPTTGAWALAQIPEAQAAFVAMDPLDGAVVSLVGGFDFYASKYNRATQARRQPGSSFKPFVYSAALENGFTQASIIADSPVVFDSKELETVWRPENYARGFGGDMMLREALIKSKNLVSVRVILKAGLRPTIGHIREFGFDDAALPVNPSLALGAGNLTPLDLTRGYSTFANGGYRVNDYLIQRIENAAGEVVFEADPVMACVACDIDPETPTDAPEEKLATDPFELYPATEPAVRVISPQNAYLMNDMMRKVVTRGTGVGAYRALGRQDIGGKTGTSNEQRDAWFSGFNGNLVAISWVGFDQERSLGAGEQGGRTALPAWNYFMREALAEQAQNTMSRPPGLVDVRINPTSGLVASASCPQSQFVTFRIGQVPPRDEDSCFEFEPSFQPEPSVLADGGEVVPEPTEPDDERLF